MAHKSIIKSAKTEEIHAVTDISTDPTFAPFADEIEALLSKKDQVLNLRSYLLAQQEQIAQKIEQIRSVNPDMSLKNVVTKIFNDLPENISAEMLLLLTRFTISAWENAVEPAVKTSVS